MMITTILMNSWCTLSRQKYPKSYNKQPQKINFPPNDRLHLICLSLHLRSKSLGHNILKVELKIYELKIAGEKPQIKSNLVMAIENNMPVGIFASMNDLFPSEYWQLHTPDPFPNPTPTPLNEKNSLIYANGCTDSQFQI